MGSATSPGDYRFTLEAGEVPREYVVHVPSGYDASRPVPVVLMFHGGGGHAKAAMVETGWAAKADQEGFIMVFPEGSRPDPKRPASFVDNPQTWNDGSGRFYAGKHSIDDVGFTRILLDDLSNRFSVDHRRIYVTGFSNGSSMAYRLGVELSDRIAAIAPVASSGLRLRLPPPISFPVSLLAIQGSTDPRNPIEGGSIIAGGELDPRPPILDSIVVWSNLLDCPRNPAIDSDENGLKTTIWKPCHGGSEVEFLLIAGMGHTWPSGRSLLPESMVGKTSKRIKAVDIIWDFFIRHSRGAP